MLDARVRQKETREGQTEDDEKDRERMMWVSAERFQIPTVVCMEKNKP